MAFFAFATAPASWASANDGVVPTMPGARAVVSQTDGGSVKLDVESPDGKVRYRWIPDPMAADGAGTIVAKLDGRATALTLRYTPAWTRPVKKISSVLRIEGQDAVLTQVFQSDGRRTTLSIRGHIIAGSLILDIAADRETLEDFRVSAPQGGGVRPFDLPYSPVVLHHSAQAGAFATAFFDWTKSAATEIAADGAVYSPKTDGRRNLLRERLIFTVSTRVAPVLPNASWPRSRFYDRTAGRLVVDVTETLRFADIEKGLEGLIDAGLSDCVLIVHVWQWMGYDNGLPSILPANDFLGGGRLLKRIGERARAAKCEFALHQNYIDYYPNSLKFDEALVARNGAGELQEAWFNSAVGQKSYSVRPRAFSLLAAGVAPEVKSSLGTTASFIDVNSGFKPWERVDMDAGEPEGGKFAAFISGSKRLFELMQDVEKGPVFGEGHNHFYWTGAVDGVEAQMTVGYAGDDDRLAPLWVDFNLLKIAPYQHNYGMGYYTRHTPMPAQSRDPMTVPENRDIYRTQQIAFGHLPYRSETLWGDPRLFVQEEALAGPVARAYGSVAAKEIRYKLGGRWVPVEIAMPAGAGRSVRVRYDNGLVVTANTADATLADDRGVLLPKGGWSATGAGVEVRSALVRGERRDFARSPGSIYADPRGAPGNWSGAGAPSTLTDFGALRTNAQSWLRCEAGRWTLRAFAARGSADLEVRDNVLAMPALLRAADGATARAVPGGAGYWRVRLTSGLRYTTDLRCGA